MNAYSPIPEGVPARQWARSLADSEARIVADTLLSALAEVPAHTDLSTSRQHALGLAAKVRFYADNDQPGMLGTNGIAPAVFACVRAAKAAGFDWRRS